MRTHTILLLGLCSLLPLSFIGCADSSHTEGSDGLLGDCNGSDCRKDDCRDRCDHDCKDNCNDHCKDKCDPPILVPLEADLEIDLSGLGLFIGLDPSCPVLDLSGDFHASVGGKAKYDKGRWLIAALDADASLQTGRGCRCSGIDIRGDLTIDVRAFLRADIASCDFTCRIKAKAEADIHCGKNLTCRAEVEAKVKARCQLDCNCPGNVIVLDAKVDADAAASVGLGRRSDLDVLIGTDLDVKVKAVVDANGKTVVAL